LPKSLDRIAGICYILCVREPRPGSIRPVSYPHEIGANQERFGMMKHRARLNLLAVIALAAGILLAAPAPVAATDPPPFPTNVRASDGTYSYMVKITWNTSAGATDYRIFRATSLDGNKTSIVNVDTTFYEDYSASPLQVYYYWVIACVDRTNCSGSGNHYGEPDSGFRGLETPTVFASDGTYADKVRINWSSSQGATSYTLYRGVSEAGYNMSIPKLTTTLYDDDTTPPGGVYYYWVKAICAIDESGMGGPDTGARNYTAPTGVAATDGSYTDKVRVTWSQTAGAARYQIWRAPAAGGAASKLGAVTAPTTLYDDATAIPGAAYSYRVSACNTAETICSAFSADPGYRALAAPAGLAASDGTYPDRVRVTWTASAGATSYTVLRGVAPGAYTTTFADILTASLDDVTAAPGTVYYYVAKACAEAGCGPLSAYDGGYRAVPTATATPTATHTPTATRTPGPTPSPTATRTRLPGLRPRTALPLLLK